jgi:hypothetical protein
MHIYGKFFLFIDKKLFIILNVARFWRADSSLSFLKYLKKILKSVKSIGPILDIIYIYFKGLLMFVFGASP